ncbi:unnamed protein product [Parajaminaea phylloscopi]
MTRTIAEMTQDTGLHVTSAGKSKPRVSHIKTPLLLSAPLSAALGDYNVYLKLDCLQPSGSFKIRGVGRAVQTAFAQRGSALHVVSSSGGNAGLAAATAARIAKVRCTVFCPQSTQDHILELLEAEGATVHREGKSFDDANRNAINAVESDPNAVLIHPFQGDDIVQGASTIIDEIYDQLRDEHDLAQGPDVISVSVGGGGLLNGLLTGLERKIATGLPAPLVIGSQCFGADAFTKSYNNGSLVKLESITSKATSMGTLMCSSQTLDKALRYPNFRSVGMDDGAACVSAWRLARDHRLLVEIACGAALAPVYFAQRLFPALFGEAKPPRKQNLVIIVCGGSKDTLDDIYTYRQQDEQLTAAARFELNGQTV